METKSPIENGLLDYLGEGLAMGPRLNPTTLLRHGQIAQEWLLSSYLGAWLELIGGLVDCDYPLARAHAVQFRALARLGKEIDPGLCGNDQVFFLGSLESLLKFSCKSAGTPHTRAMQWGVDARDVAMAVVDGFIDSKILNPVICEAAVPCAMYAAFLVSQVVTDAGVAEEIAVKMFEELPRGILDTIRRVPESPEA